MNLLFKPLRIGALELANRVIMAPLTRGRATDDGIPTERMAEYYAQRASAGLIIAEATAVSAEGRGWMNSPGLFNQKQQQGWEKIAERVHSKKGRIFVQLWHMGAAVHPDFNDGDQPVSSSAVTLKGALKTPEGRDRQFVEPRALTTDEIDARVQQFVTAARRAVDAGIDGVELHAANGFLIDQFTRDSSNKRVDAYGGSIDNRLRFMLEVVSAVSAEVGADRVGVRLSPTNSVWGISDSQYEQTFVRAVERLLPLQLAYIHLLENKPGGDDGMHTSIDYLTPKLAALIGAQAVTKLIVNGGYNRNSAHQTIVGKQGDAVAFGMPFIANPDLVERFKTGAVLAEPDTSTFYTNDAQGYTDYGALVN